jgi:hypothetical protein
MKRTPALLALLAAFALAGTPAAASANITLGITPVSGGTFNLTHPAGTAWPGFCDIYTRTAISVWVMGNYSVAPTSNPFNTAGSGDGWDSTTQGAKIVCPDMRVADKDATGTQYGTVRVPGGHTVSRSSGAYSLGGNCNWGGDGSGGMISTCLFAHAAASYRLVLPLGRTYTGMTHSVSNGIFACRNSGWVTARVGTTRAYTTTFHHGDSTGYSQCDIRSSTLHYKWTSYTTTYIATTTLGLGYWKAP